MNELKPRPEQAPPAQKLTPRQALSLCVLGILIVSGIAPWWLLTSVYLLGVFLSGYFRKPEPKVEPSQHPTAYWEGSEIDP